MQCHQKPQANPIEEGKRNWLDHQSNYARFYIFSHYVLKRQAAEPPQPVRNYPVKR